MSTRILLLLALFLSAALACRAADFKKGGTAYTKRQETALLAEPKPLAATVGKVAFALPLKIEEINGQWLRVSTAKVPKISGWVYAGNVADSKPTTAPLTGMTANTASKTTVAAAARPLTKAATDYAQSRNLGSSAGHDWLDALAATISEADVTRYQVETKRGEYRQ